MMHKKIVTYYTRKPKNVKNEFFITILDFLSFSKTQIITTRYPHTFKFSYLFKNDKIN